MQKYLRIGAGVIFLVAGVGKLLLPVLVPLFKPGAPVFGDVLSAVGVPLPYLTCYAICILEVVGGTALLRGRCVPAVSLLLAGNMVGAMVTVSIPGTFREPLHIGGLDLGGEIWRLPLEASLFLTMLWLAKPWKPKGLLAC